MITCDCGQPFKKEANHKVHLRTEKHRIQLAKKHGVSIPPPLESVPASSTPLRASKKVETTDKVVQHMETAVKVLTNTKDIYQDVQEKIEQSKDKSLIQNIETFLELGLKWIHKLR